MKQTKETFLTRLRRFVDGNADTPFEYFMLFVVVVNTVVLGLETSPDLSEKYGSLFILIDQICLWIFIAELLLKAIAFNRQFFGEFRTDGESGKYFHVNKWNIFDLFIVLVSVFASLPFFAVFRVLRLFKSVKIIKGIKSLRVIKTLKLVNGITKLRIIVKAVIKAIPSVLWTFCLLVIFSYVYAIIGVNVFGADFTENFGSLGSAFLSLFNLSGFDSSTVIQRFSWSWIYFISYNFFEASIIMNVIVGVIVDSVNTSRKEIEDEDKKDEDGKTKEKVTLESLSTQIAELQKTIQEMKKG
ncbi:MAG: ion transporter [Treponema sp.]|nr:ion transporter [Treponema sp.]